MKSVRFVMNFTNLIIDYLILSPNLNLSLSESCPLSKTNETKRNETKRNETNRPVA